MSRFPIEFIEKFWSLVEKSDEPDGCWLWTRKPATSGYGQVNFPKVSPQPMTTHRVSWEIANGPIPLGLHVLHTCDIRLCVRPKHLFLGTQLDNNIDRQLKGRTASGDANGARTQRHRNPFVRDGGSGLLGEKHPQSKLSDQEIRQIRQMFATGHYTRTALGIRFGISVTHVSRIIESRTRKTAI